MFFNNSFILASSSKSRYKILKAVKLSFATKTPRCNEEQIKHKIKKSKFSPKKISEVLAKEKSKSISKLFKKKLVVGSDTVISFRQNIIDLKLIIFCTKIAPSFSSACSKFFLDPIFKI